jgi:predicted transport protein
LSDIKLFKLKNNSVTELEGQSIAVEKSLQALIEKNCEEFLGVRFLKSEYETGKQHGGRIDSLGIDENNSPVIIEYKRSTNENVINQGLFYLDWLLDHKAEFQVMVMERYGKEDADNIEWTSARLICIAGGYTKYDEYAVKQIDRNIELLRYRKYGEEMFLLELVNATSSTTIVKESRTTSNKKSNNNKYTTATEHYENMDQEHKDRYESLKAYIYGLGDDIQEKTLKYYVAFKRIKNFACFEFHPYDGEILIFLKIDPSSISLEEGFSRDVTNIGTFGTGNLEIRVSSEEDVLKAEPLILKSYDGS